MKRRSIGNKNLEAKEDGRKLGKELGRIIGRKMGRTIGKQIVNFAKRNLRIKR